MTICNVLKTWIYYGSTREWLLTVSHSKQTKLKICMPITRSVYILYAYAYIFFFAYVYGHGIFYKSINIYHLHIYLFSSKYIYIAFRTTTIYLSCYVFSAQCGCRIMQVKKKGLEEDDQTICQPHRDHKCTLHACILCSLPGLQTNAWRIYKKVHFPALHANFTF